MLVAGGDSPEVFGFAEEAFDEVALFVDFGVMADAKGTASAGGDHGLGAGLIDRGAEVIGIVGTVGKDVARRQVGNECLGLGDVAVLAGGDYEADGVAQAVDRDVQLGCQAASTTTNGAIFRPPFLPVACWCARTMVESMIR